VLAGAVDLTGAGVCEADCAGAAEFDARLLEADVGWLLCPTTTATDSAATQAAIRILVIKRSQPLPSQQSVVSHATLPARLDTSERYSKYAHGLIVSTGLRPESSGDSPKNPPVFREGARPAGSHA
jgi:hypothetical protein